MARDGALREIKLGEFGPMTLAEARKALGRLKVERERGIDPQVEKHQARAEARRQRETQKLRRYTVEKLVEDYISVVLFTGFRSGEVVAALWRDVDLERAVWTIRETKNGKQHDVMLLRQAIALLKARRALHDIFVFPSRRDGHHVVQKALGLAQYEARKEKEGGALPGSGRPAPGRRACRCPQRSLAAHRDDLRASKGRLTCLSLRRISTSMTSSPMRRLA